MFDDRQITAMTVSRPTPKTFDLLAPLAPEPAPAPAASSAPGPTPVMAQYFAIKAEHPDHLLFYRMGDFYELFFQDAMAAAQILDIALTKRGKHEGADIPMCGVPVHAAEAYLLRLIRSGRKVAVCEQIEEPEAAKRRGAKAVIRREVVRLVTPGTLTEDALLDARRNNYLAALARAEGRFGLAFADISTGAFRTEEIEASALLAEMARLQPGELLVAENLRDRPELIAAFEGLATLTVLPPARFDSLAGERRLCGLFHVATLDGFGAFGRAELAAAGALVDYLDLTQRGKLPCLKPPVQERAGASMAIDAATRRNLELAETLSGDRTGSLLATIDRTATGAGARLLGQRLAQPLCLAEPINRRLDMVEGFLIEAELRDDVRRILRRVPDLERALSRLALSRGGPRDLAAIRDGLTETRVLKDRLAQTATPLPAGTSAARAALGSHEALVAELARALAPELPLFGRDGGFIAPGYRPELDELRLLRDESRRHIAALQDRYSQATGIPGLKIRHNNVLGYYIEVTPRFAERMGEGFIHRQTMANAVRYSTVELGELEAKIGQAADRALSLELSLFESLSETVIAAAEPIGRAADALAEIDVAAGLAALAAERNYRRPKVDDSLAFRIRGGRHPVVEAALDARGERFISNDSDLGETQRLWLVTGPNMAGKSTFLRQNALIALMAQIGSFVPADEAEIGAVDRLFSRVGAADDLARGRSTFMVEMVETAAILNQAGPRALVILDEIGRGTATFDGLSLAWATVEHLHDVNRCRALFATHFHELTGLAARLAALACHAMRVKEWQGDVVFLHEVVPGAADRSYGIQVAKLAGLPPAVLTRAAEVLHALEQSGRGAALVKLADDLPLFQPDQPEPEQASEIEALLRVADLDSLTPRQALDLLYQLRALLS